MLTALALALLSAPAGVPAPLIAPAAQDGKRAFEISDYYRTAFVGAPAISSDGQWVAFSVRRYDVEADESWSELWRVRPDGTGLRQMTTGREQDGSPSFSPDGSRVLFTSSRSGSSQLWTMPVDGGEPTQLTDFAPGVSDPLWSPDGRWIAVTSEVWPDCGADEDCHTEREEAAEKGKLSVHVADELLYRHWTSWADGKVSHVLLVDAASGAVVRDMTPGPWPSPTFSLGGDRGYSFSADGGELYFVSDRSARQAEETNADVWRVSVESEGSAINLTDANDGWDGAPLVSPDGALLAYVSQQTPGFEADLRRLAVIDAGTSDGARYLTERDGFDDMVDDLRWAPDGSALYFQASVKGRTPIYRIGLEGGEPALVLQHGQLGGWELTPDGETIVYVRRTVGEPPELFAAPVAGGEPRRLTHFNAELEAEVDIRPAEELWVPGDGDDDVHVFVVKPHGFQEGRRYPLILNVHGGPQSQWTDAYRGDWQVYPGKGYVVAFCNPTGSTGYGQVFTDGISRDWGGRVYRDLMKVTDALEELPYVDPERMGAMGWSYGGYMMMWMQGHTDRFACQVAMMGLYDLRSFYGATEELWFPEYDLGGSPWTSGDYEKWSPSNHVRDFKTPALVITGELDYRVPYTQSLQYFTALQKQGVPSRLVVMPTAGHWPGWREMIFYYNAHLDWFARYLGGEPAPYDVIEHARRRGIPPAEDE
jgi:dipeptidyl aminopeptidase/acylaminoacyl peptidase